MKYQHETMRNLSCKRLQCDEIWSFVGCKEKNVKPEMRGVLGSGDVWTWTAIDADTKLVPSFLVGARDANYAVFFMQDLASRLAHRVQLTTDGLKVYMEAVGLGFHGDIDYAMLVKHYGTDPHCRGPLQPRDLHGLREEDDPGQPRSRGTSPRRLSSGRTSRCGCG